MLYGIYRFFCVFQNDAYLPYYKGSTFRGVFGRALKKVVCALKKEECSQCLLKQRCIYALVFETSISLAVPEGSRTASPPHPFVIEPPLTTETKFSKGSSFNFNLLLFGEINNSLPYFIYAFEQMGKIGIGKKINGGRGRFILKEVRNGDSLIYSAADRQLNTASKPEVLSIGDPANLSDKKLSLKLICETPLRLKFENRLKAELPFHVLVRAMLRRVSSLFNWYGAGEPPLDYKGLVKKAASVQTLDSSLKWFDWKRYSFRQNKSMLMGGITGSITFKGDLTEYLPIIELCSKVHLGKQTSFGLGKIKAEIIK
ncbi:MAG: CRISPR system precrRNA processing endoribonuclease RAMP protein Cas6 [Deltaproteobacteria bacterium]|nr:CRISPR system precrRNA processing endoribonuclease RAMP protein Cas6 [Deltaproteobacteria bacterium]